MSDNRRKKEVVAIRIPFMNGTNYLDKFKVILYFEKNKFNNAWTKSTDG